MKVKSILALAVSAFTLAALAATSTPKGFTDDLDAALAQAKTSGKYVYACFSGSDWCCWCQKLEQEVFSDKTFDFVGALKDEYLFVFIDNPSDKDLLSEAAKERNPKLTKKFKVRGFPTALILNGEGETVEKTGYRKGGAKAYADYLHEVRKNGPKLMAQHKREAEIDAKYFTTVEAEIRALLVPLNRGKPTAEQLTKAADELEKIAAKVEGMSIDEADKDLVTKKRDILVKQMKRLVGAIRQDATKPAKKAAQPTEKK